MFGLSNVLAASREARKQEIIAQEQYKMYSMEQSFKMTREEAVKKIMIENRCSDFTFMREKGYAEAYIKGLEALGLIKFDEEKDIRSPSSIIADVFIKTKPTTIQSYEFADKCIETLVRAGYKMERNVR